MYIDLIGEIDDKTAIAAPRSPYENLYIMGLILESMKREQKAYTPRMWPEVDRAITTLEAFIDTFEDVLDRR